MPQEMDFDPGADAPAGSGASVRPISTASRGANAFLILIIVGGAVACIGVVGWQLLGPGPFLWHVQQPRFIEGGIEALILASAIGATQTLASRGWRIALTILVAEIYLRRHGVDAALLVDLVYFELAIALGAFVARCCDVKQAANLTSYLHFYVLGFLAWSACAWTISALGWGGLRDLRILTALLALPAISARARPWCVFVEGKANSMTPASRFAMGALAACFLILIAHSANAVGYDGQWYGLRGDRVLVGAGSVFTSQGLVSPVYYFPKLYELYLVPLSGFGSSSVVAGTTILILGLIAAATYDLLGHLGIRETLPRIVCVGVMTTLPAIANTALETKGDLLSVFLLILAWTHAAEFIATRNRVALLWLISLILLATQARLTAIPFGSLLLFATIIACLRTRRTAVVPPTTESRLAWTGFVLALGVTAFVTSRTLLLTGVPTIGPDQLFKLWKALGFTLNFPVGMLRWNYPTQWSDVPTLIVDLLFRPERLTMIVITWTGNVWAWLGFIALIAGAASRLSRVARETEGATALVRGGSAAAARSFFFLPGAVLAATAFMLMLCWGFSYPGGDGNYFIAGIAAATMLAFVAAWRRVPTKLRPLLLFAICGFWMFHESYSFASAAWTGGTRPFNWNFHRSAREFKDESGRLFREDGMVRIASYLRHLDHNARVVGCTELLDTLGMRLPASFENVAQIAYSHPDFTASTESFAPFLKNDAIEYLLVPTANNQRAVCTRGEVLIDTAAELQRKGVAPVVADDGYLLYSAAAMPQR